MLCHVAATLLTPAHRCLRMRVACDEESSDKLRTFAPVQWFSEMLSRHAEQNLLDAMDDVVPMSLSWETGYVVGIVLLLDADFARSLCSHVLDPDTYIRVVLTNEQGFRFTRNAQQDGVGVISIGCVQEAESVSQYVHAKQNPASHGVRKRSLKRTLSLRRVKRAA